MNVDFRWLTCKAAVFILSFLSIATVCKATVSSSGNEIEQIDSQNNNDDDLNQFPLRCDYVCDAYLVFLCDGRIARKEKLSPYDNKYLTVNVATPEDAASGAPRNCRSYNEYFGEFDGFGNPCQPDPAIHELRFEYRSSSLTCTTR